MLSLWGSVMKWVYICHTKLITDAKAMWFSTPSKNVWHFSLKIIKDWVSFLIWFRYGTNIVEWLLVKKEVPHTSCLKWWPSLQPPALLEILIIRTTLSTYKILWILWIFSWASFGLYIALGLWQAEGCWLLSQAMICEDSIQQSRSEDRSRWWQAWAGGTQVHSPPASSAVRAVWWYVPSHMVLQRAQRRLQSVLLTAFCCFCLLKSEGLQTASMSNCACQDMATAPLHQVLFVLLQGSEVLVLD